MKPITRYTHAETIALFNQLPAERQLWLIVGCEELAQYVLKHYERYQMAIRTRDIQQRRSSRMRRINWILYISYAQHEGYVREKSSDDLGGTACLLPGSKVMPVLDWDDDSNARFKLQQAIANGSYRELKASKPLNMRTHYETAMERASQPPPAKLIRKPGRPKGSYSVQRQIRLKMQDNALPMYQGLLDARDAFAELLPNKTAQEALEKILKVIKQASIGEPNV